MTSVVIETKRGMSSKNNCDSLTVENGNLNREVETLKVQLTEQHNAVRLLNATVESEHEAMLLLKTDICCVNTNCNTLMVEHLNLHGEVETLKKQEVVHSDATNSMRESSNEMKR